MRRRWNIARKLAAIYLVVAVPLSLVLGFVYYQWYRARVSQVAQERLGYARLASTTFDLLITELHRAMSINAPRLVDETPEQAEATLRRLAAEYPVEHVAITDSRGTIVAASDPRLLGRDFSGEPAFQAALDSPDGAGIEPGEREPGGVVGFHVSQAFGRSDGRAAGVAMMLVDVKKLRDQLRINVTVGSVGVYDPKGQVVYLSRYPPAAERLAKWGLTTPVVRAALNGRETSSDRLRLPIDRRPRIGAGTPIAGVQGWAAASSVDRGAALTPIYQSLLLGMPLAILIGILALAVSVGIARSISRSLERLVDDASRLGRGELESPIREPRGDEIGDLAVSLEEARLGLHEYVRGLGALADAGALLSRSLTEPALKLAVLDSLRRLFHPVACWLFLHDEETDELYPWVWEGEGAEEYSHDRVPSSVGPLGRVFTTRRPLVTEDIAEMQGVSNPDLARKYGRRTVSMVPLRFGERTLGVLGVAAGHEAVRLDRERALGLLTAFASQVAIAVRNLQLFAEQAAIAESLREQTETLGAVIASSPLAMISVGRDGSVLSWNEAAERIFGWLEAEALGQYLPFVSDEHHEDFEQMLEQVWAGVPLTGAQARRHRKDGTPITVGVSAAPVRGAEGEVERVILMVEDVTDRAKAQAEAEQNRRLLQAIIDNSQSAIYLKDTQFRYILANETAADVLGITPSEMLGRRDADLMPKENAQRIRETDKRILETKRRQQVEEQLPVGGEDHIFLSTKFPLLDRAGEVYGIAGISTDITDRIHAEEVLRLRALLLDATADSVFVYLVEPGPEQGVIVYVNEAAAVSRGRERDELLGEYIQDIVSERVRPMWDRWFMDLLEQGGMFAESESIRADGSSFPVEVRASVIEYLGQRVAISLARDISDRKLAERLDDALDIVNAAVNSSLEFDEIMSRLVAETVQAVEADSGVIYMREKDGWEARYVFGLPRELIGRRFTSQEIRHSEIAAEQGEALIINDAADMYNALGDYGVRATLDVALTVGEELIGDFSLHYHSDRRFEAAHADFAEKVASSLTLAIRNSRLYDAQRRSADLGDRLNRINAIIASTLESETSLQLVVTEAARALETTGGLLELATEQGWTVRFIAERAEPTNEPPLTEDVSILRAAERAGDAITVADVRTDPRFDAARLEAAGVRSFLAVPLVARGETVGVLVFFNDSPGMLLDESQLDFTRKLAVSVSLAIENARLYAEERGIADTLQQAILAIPEHVEGVVFSRLYRSATEAAKVGGDFYDVFELEHGRVGILLGDVSGKGLEAATLTSLVKNTVRAYALEHDSPAEVIARANAAVFKAVPSWAFVTLFFGLFDTASCEFSYCNAGHPPGIVERHDGRLDMLEATGPLIGAFADLPYEEATICLGERDVLVLYTDGVIEARLGHELFGEERLIDFLRREGPLSVSEIPEAVFKEVLAFTGGTLADDVALFALCPSPKPKPERDDGSGNGSPDPSSGSSPDSYQADSTL